MAVGGCEEIGIRCGVSIGGADGNRRKQSSRRRGVEEMEPGFRWAGVVWMLSAISVDEVIAADDYRTVW